jgi:hypothetical protein
MAKRAADGCLAANERLIDLERHATLTEPD